MIGKLGSWLQRRTRLLVLAVLVLVAYAGAINRAQSLPWFIAAMLLATLMVGLAWPHWLVGRLSVTRRGPDRAEEGESITFHVDVRNHGYLPRFMVELVDRLPFVGAAAGAPQGGASTLGMIGYVPGRSTRQFAMPLVCEKRGFYQLGPVGLASSFPLGLAEARQQRNEGVHSLTVYPAVFPIMNMALRGAPSQIHRGGYLLPEGAGAAEFSGLREYRQGDNPRHIHWPTTARMNELMVKQFEPLASACLYIALDLAAGSNVGQGRHVTLEYAARIAASIARFSCYNNIRTRMVGAGARQVEVDVGSGALQYQRILDELAIVDSDGSRPYASVLEEIATRAIDGETVAVFLSQPASESVDVFNALTLLRAKRAHVFAIVFERGSFADAAASVDTQADAATGVLQELDAQYLRVRRGDDLVHLFNT
jgi:uncharacterized protein (DUF58 family)